jgi:hypothetical protein
MANNTYNCWVPINKAPKENKAKRGFAINQKMVNKRSSVAKYGTIKPTKPINHQLELLINGDKQANKNNTITNTLDKIKNIHSVFAFHTNKSFNQQKDKNTIRVLSWNVQDFLDSQYHTDTLGNKRKDMMA